MLGSMLALPVVVFSAEYVLVPISSVVVFYSYISGFFDYTSIGRAYRATDNAGFLYYSVFLLSMIPMYSINMMIAAPFIAKLKNIEYLIQKDNFGTLIKRVALVLVFPVSLVALPGVYVGRPISVFPPNSFGIFSYSFYYFGFCFFTMTFWGVLAYKKRK